MDSSIPPSYEEANTRDYWSIIAQYIKSADLCAASLVSKRWHQMFAPYLWGNPASHFGTENDRVYVALTRFKRILPRVRVEVRQLTHTLRLPPAQSELYDGPHSEWLRDILEQLPNLQSLVVSQLPFFDHAALLALRQSSAVGKSGNEDQYPVFPLRLLIATQCANTTSASLSEALLHWPSLVFLDLSDTLAARDHGTLSSLRYMPGLQVLKLRHVNLRDDDIDILADAIGIRVRYLDLRDNKFTDTSVRKLLNTCFNSTPNLHPSERSVPRGLPNGADEDWPSFFPRPSSIVLDVFRAEDIDKRFVKWLTNGVVSRLPSEDLPRSGLTHLYIANNFLTVEGVASLLKSRDLNILDVGAVDTAKALGRPRTHSSTSHPLEHSISLPGVEKLIPVLEHYAHKNLTYLRIHHAVVTEPCPIRGHPTFVAELSAEDTSSVAEVAADESGIHELSTDEAPSYELDANAPVYELAGNDATPKFELPGDPMHFMVSPPIGERPSMTPNERAVMEINRGSIYAPEPVHQDSRYEEDDEGSSVVLTPTGLGNIAQAVNGITSHSSNENNMISPKLSNTGDANESFSDNVATIIQRRQKLRSRDESQSQGLLPGTLPALRCLVITNIPCTSNNHHVVDALKKFICNCAEEAKLANLQSTLEHKLIYVYGKPRSMHHQYRVRELFSLEHLILEMAPPREKASYAGGPSSPRGPLSPLTPRTPPPSDTWFNQSRSSTEDADTEAMWNAQKDDFSFFGDEECGLPAAEPGMHFPRSALSEKMLLPSGNTEDESLPTLQHRIEPEVSVDIVEELAKFRKERKAAYEGAVSRGEKYADGYWPGEVKIIRHQRNNSYRSENLDWYGNYFEKGIYR